MLRGDNGLMRPNSACVIARCAALVLTRSRRRRIATTLMLVAIGPAACAIVGRVGGEESQRGIDVNRASVTRLETLPGVDATLAERIVAARPYATKDELVHRGVIDEPTFEQVRDRIYVGSVDGR